MTKTHALLLLRVPKFIIGNLMGTLVDTVVLWLFSHFVFSGYVGEVIVSPIISFECAVLVNFLVSYHFTWRDRVVETNPKSFLRHFWPYNVSCIGGFVIKMGALMLIQFWTKWDVVICNLLALCVSGTFNFVMNEFVVFRKRKER